MPDTQGQNKVSQFTFEQVEKKLETIKFDQPADHFLNGEGNYIQISNTGGGTQYDDTDIKNDLQGLTTRVDNVEADMTNKANSADVYKKTEVDDAIAQAQLNGQVDLSDYAKNADVDLKLADKANTVDVYTKTETYNQTEID